MSIQELIVYGQKYLPTHQVNMLLSYLLDNDKLEIINYLNDIVDEQFIIKYKKMINEINCGIPIQYVIGSVNFYGYEFIVNKDVLIPRFETEELVENTIQLINKLFPTGAKVIDLGCGSGVIGITLKKENSNLDITCLDISDPALDICKKNANKLGANINIIKGNMLDDVCDKYDVIISNPPYIGTNEAIEDIVKNNEPHIALYAGVDGLDYYKQILLKAKSVLNNKYLIAFEIGCNQKNDIINLVNDNLGNVNVVSKKDLSGKDRMIFIYSD